MKKIISKSLFCVMLLMLISVAVSLATFVSFAETYFTVRVEYRFVDDSVAHDPYVAVLAEGKDVHITVNNPALPGYKPQRSKELSTTIPAEKTTQLDYENLQANHEIIIYYVPDEVPYRVHYFKQNIRDDLYTEQLELSCRKTGRTGETPEDLVIPFEGFTVLSHEPDVIAADGSTQFKIYYDRNYYLVDFELDGGYGVEPVYGKFGSVYNIAEPTRKGWVFEGWVLADKDGNYVDENGNVLTDEQAKAAATKFSSGTIPSKNVYYKAYWSAGTTHYTVVYWVENPDDDEYTDVAVQDIYQYEDGCDVTTGDTVSIGDASAEHSVPDFFSYNLNPQKVQKKADGSVQRDGDLRPIYVNNDDGEPIDDDGKVIDFPEMSPGERKELSNHAHCFELDLDKSGTTAEVSGDGTTRVNVYYNRKKFNQRFIYARSYVDNSGNTVYELPGPTKAFSHSPNKTLEQHLLSMDGERTGWMQAECLPVLKDEYNDIFYKKSDITVNTNDYPTSATPHHGVCTYYYLEAKDPVEYYADMTRIWKLDAFDPVPMVPNSRHNPPVPANTVATFGAWSVEGGTRYADTHANRTVKGIYERLDNELLRTDNRENYTDLYYLSYWTCTYSEKWNTKALQYQFDYEYYVQALPRTPASQFYTGEKPNGADNMNFILHNSVTTFDGGDQYQNVNTRDANIRTNQTPAGLAGFELIGYRLQTSGKNKGSVVLDDNNCVINWIDDNHAVIKFFYRRCYYSLIFLNNNVKEPAEITRNIYYQMDINSVSIRGNWVYFEPQYPDADMRDYYVFGGWYFDEDHTEKIPVIENDPAYADVPAHQKHFCSDFKMPADDVTLYAKWDLVKEDVSFYRDYKAFITGAAPINQCRVDYNDRILTADVPTTVQTATAPYLEPPAHATFAGWYYLNETNTPVRFDPESMPVTRELKLYARWSSEETAQYQITYVEKGTGVEVAPPTTGTAFVHQTRTFQAKAGSQLNDAHSTSERAWRPTVASHSLSIESNESGQAYAPNTFAFEYFRKENVWYRVRYLNSQNGKPVHDPKELSTSLAIVTESPVALDGFIADAPTKSAVLAASDNEDDDIAKNQELEANTITFWYTPNDTATLYRVSHYVEKVDGSGYELNKEENNVGELGAMLSLTDAFNDSPTAQTLIGSGFTFASDETRVNGDEAQADAYELTGEPLMISFFYTRNKYAYKVNYVDYETEQILKTTVFNGDDQLQPVYKEVIIEPESHFDYVPSEGADPIGYTRISDRVLSMTIHPDNRDNPTVNVINVYYRKDVMRLLRFKVSCDHETDDKYADVSDSHLIVEYQSDIRPVTAIPYTLDDHVYTFLGWYAVPQPGESDTQLSADLSYEPPLPGADMTYYAVFHQEQVKMNVEIMYNDTGVYDSTAVEDTDGSVTGHEVVYTSPLNYSAGSDTPMDKMQKFNVSVSPKDNKFYYYQFAGWYFESNGSYYPDPENTTKQLTAVRTQDQHYIAMFKKVTEVPCQITYRFTPRVANDDTKEDGRNEYVIKKTLQSDEFGKAITDGPRLNADYVMSLAPYESNHGEALSWDKDKITYSNDNGVLSATLIADQQKQKVTVNYRLEPGVRFTAFRTTVGSNRRTDPQLEALDVRDKTYNGKYFSYWKIRSGADDNSPEIGRCYEPWFSFRIWEDYWITPVFESDSDAAPDPPTEASVTLTKLDDSRNRWTDSDGKLRDKAYSDYLYTDFEVAFEGPDVYSEASSYQAGMVFEVCGKYTDGTDLSACSYVSDEDNLKEAVRTNVSGNSSYVYAKEGDAEQIRTIQINPISTEELSTRSRAQYGKAFRNVISASTGLPTNGNYIFKVYAYLIKDGNVTLSNPVYVCMHDVAVRDLMFNTQDSP